MDDKETIARLKEVIANKDHALEHALDRLTTIQMFSGRKDFEGVRWESGATITRIKNILKLQE